MSLYVLTMQEQIKYFNKEIIKKQKELSELISKRDKIEKELELDKTTQNSIFIKITHSCKP